MENEKVVKNSNKLLIALIVLTSVNLLVGIINIGLITKNNIKPRKEKQHIRQEMMFGGCDFNNGCPMMGRGGKGQFDNRPNFSGRNNEGNRPNNKWQNNDWQRQYNDNQKPQNNDMLQNNMPQNNKPEMNIGFNTPQ